MAVTRAGRTLKSSEQKKLVMQWTGWSSARYNKEYDKLRNRVRNFEKAATATKQKINVADLLLREERAKYYAKKQGREYVQSPLYAAVSAAPSTSTGAESLTRSAREKISAARERLTEAEFGGFIKNSKYAEEIARAVEEAKRRGYYSGAFYYSLVRTYATKLDEERKQIVALNKLLEDRSKVVFFES